MAPSGNPRAHIGFERRRQIQVRKSFVGGLRQETGGLDDFYKACGRYLVTSLIRLDEQDQKISDLLKDKVPTSETDLHEKLAILDERQRKCRIMTDTFDEAVKAFENGGDAVSFKNAAEIFVAEFEGMMAPRKNPLSDFTDEHFTNDDWIYIADWTEAARLQEEADYERICHLAPEGLDPTGFKADHLPSA